MEQKTVKIENSEMTSRIFGSFDANVRMIEASFGVQIYNRSDEDGDAVMISGESADGVAQAAQAVRYLGDMAKYNDTISDQQVGYVIDMIKDGRAGELSSFSGDCICITAKGKPIKAKTIGQKNYVGAISITPFSS